MAFERVGEFTLSWGESLVWDDDRQRLYFIDVLPSHLCWLEGGIPPLQRLPLTSRPTGVGLAEDGRLLVAMSDGIYLIDVDKGQENLLANYPTELGHRANDLTVDPSGNLVTGTLNIPAGAPIYEGAPLVPGSYWQFSILNGWIKLDDGITNANGPVCISVNDNDRLIFSDTPAQKIYAYDYDHARGIVRPKQIFANTDGFGGAPDGACATSEGEVVSCILGGGVLARITSDQSVQLIDACSEQPSDVCFGGRNIDKLFLVSIAIDLGRGWGKPKSPMAGALMCLEGAGMSGLPENRFRL
jgi:L-arabinonolactonase